MKNAVFVCCNDFYAPLAIIALKCFQKLNNDYDMYVIGTWFMPKNISLCEQYNVKSLTVDLKNDFINLDKRPYGKQYPIECFYNFYAYKLLPEYDYVVSIEPDIYTNRQLDIDFNQIQYVAGSYSKSLKITDFTPLMNDMNKIKTKYHTMDTLQNRILGGLRIYNTRGAAKIKFYETIVEYYKTSIQINAQRCGDDSLMGMYQLLNKQNVTLLDPRIHVIQGDYPFDEIYLFHFANGPKYWIPGTNTNISRTARYFRDKFIEYIYNNFDPEFIKTYVPAIYKNV